MQPTSPAPGRQDAPRPRVSRPHPRQYVNSEHARVKLSRACPDGPSVVPDNDPSWDDDFVYQLGPVFPDEQEWSSVDERSEQ